MNKVEWISVKDRIPEPEVDILIYTAHGCIYTAEYCPGFFYPNYEGRFGFNDITHWAELPEPPKD